MSRARIYKPNKPATQSGRATERAWVLVHAPQTPLWHDPLMGWTASADTTRQITLRFETRAQAIAYAKKHGIDYSVETPRARKRPGHVYADNFARARRDLWTH